MRANSNDAYRGNHLKCVTEDTYNPETNFGALRETLPSPMAERREAAHYVHDHAFGYEGTQDLEEWL